MKTKSDWTLLSRDKMGLHKLFYQDAKVVRDSLNEVIQIADEIQFKERILIEKLKRIDQNRFYVRYGYRSLSGFCRLTLNFSKTQTQRLVTQVRRAKPTDNIVDKMP